MHAQQCHAQCTRACAPEGVTAPLPPARMGEAALDAGVPPPPPPAARAPAAVAAAEACSCRIRSLACCMARVSWPTSASLPASSCKGMRDHIGWHVL
jgi:hypothetical protein